MIAKSFDKNKARDAITDTDKDKKELTATEVQMEMEAKMRSENNERLINDDMAFRLMVLAKLDMIEERLNSLCSFNYSRRGLLG